MGFSKLKIPKVCEQCHKPFEAKTITTRFCSNSCASKNGKERKKQEKELQEKEDIIEKYADKIAVLQHREFISVKEATVLFGIPKSTIHRFIKQNLIHSVNIGERLTRINKEELKRLITPAIVPEENKEEEKLLKKNKKESDYYQVKKKEKEKITPSIEMNIIKSKPIKCIVKIRKAEFKEEWYIYIECYPIYEANKETPIRDRIYIGRSVGTVVFDETRPARTDKNGFVSYRPKRDENGIIICESDLDKETMLFADAVRRKLQKEYDNQYLFNKKLIIK